MTLQQVIRWQSKVITAKGDHQPMMNNFFTWPNQIAYVLDMRNGEIVESAGNYGNVFGYSKIELSTLPHLYEPILSRHRSQVVDYSQTALAWAFQDINYDPQKTYVQYGYRIRHSSGKIKRVLKQGTLLREPDGSITHSFCTITDISSIDSRNEVTVQAFGPRAHLFDSELPEIKMYHDQLSLREIEILKLVARGRSSNQIAQDLNVSKHTIDTHRRNMIRKMEVCNSIELINLAREMGLFK